MKRELQKRIELWLIKLNVTIKDSSLALVHEQLLGPELVEDPVTTVVAPDSVSAAELVDLATAATDVAHFLLFLEVGSEVDLIEVGVHVRRHTIWRVHFCNSIFNNYFTLANLNLNYETFYPGFKSSTKFDKSSSFELCWCGDRSFNNKLGVYAESLLFNRNTNPFRWKNQSFIPS